MNFDFDLYTVGYAYMNICLSYELFNPNIKLTKFLFDLLEDEQGLRVGVLLTLLKDEYFISFYIDFH